MAQAAERRSGPEIFDEECSSAEDCAGRMMQEEDQLRFLTRLRERLDSLNIDLPKIEIRFDKLNVEANARKQKRALPTLWNATINLMELKARNPASHLKFLFPVVRPGDQAAGRRGIIDSGHQAASEKEVRSLSCPALATSGSRNK
ncbi:hypothetical protein EJ110_NYTH36637 [Nymphaea thermarum]|nr:hypothetical protein EJ110_NYTH36637 [Nymphaea thermarum]